MAELRQQIVHALADRYAIEREVGAGGMATVYLARDVKHDRLVALKILDPELAAVMGVERFLSEIRVMAHLQHPNLLPLFDSGETPFGSLYYVMPFVEGETLRRRLDREKQLPVDEVVRIAMAIGSALDYAHRHGVVHRDLKPENVLFQDGQPVVADFGIALAVSHAGGHRLTQTGVSLGTPAYMSPEQATGDRAIDGRTDIYSLGTIVYEMLTGEPPHTGATAQAIIARVLTERPRPVRAVRPSVPAYIESAVDRALEKLPADRWETAGAFSDAIAGRLPTIASPSFARGLRLRGLLAPIPIVLLVAALASSALALAQWRARNRVDPGRPIRFTTPWTGADRSGISPAPAISPDGRTIAYSGLTANGRVTLFVRSLDELAAREVPGTDGALQPSFSPDGEWVAYFSSGAVRKVHLTTGAARILARLSSLPLGTSWGPGDLIVLCVDGRLWTLNATSGALKQITSLDSANGELSQKAPIVLPDGRTVLFLSWHGTRESSRIGVATLPTGAIRYLDIAGDPLGLIDDILVYVNAAERLSGVPFVDGNTRGAPVQLPEQIPLSSGVARAALSQSGTLIYTAGLSLGQLVLLDSQGNARPLLSDPRYYTFPRLSPDGKKVAVSVGSPNSVDVYIYDIASGTPTRLTTEGARNDRAEWTPDGKAVLYSSAGSNMTALWMRNADLSGTPLLLAGSRDEQVLEGILSPDGNTLVYRSTSAKHPFDLWYRALRDTTPRTLVSSPSLEYGPRISPDGRWIAYASNQDGPFQVYVQPFPPTGPRYQVSDVSGSSPLWSRDGQRIYYVGEGSLMVATIRSTPDFVVLSRAPVHGTEHFAIGAPVHANYDVTADGRHLLLIKPLQSDAGLIVVHDWAYELRDRVRTARR